MAFPTTEQLAELIRPVTDAHGLDIENIRSVPAGKKSSVQIALDSDERPSLDDLGIVSQEIGELFDDAEAAGKVSFGAGYTLEVSTPGVDTPLTEPRHWRRNRHRVVTLDGQQWRIGAMSPAEDSVILFGKNGESRELAFSEDVSPVVDIEFNNPPQSELELSGMTYNEATTWREDNK